MKENDNNREINNNNIISNNSSHEFNQPSIRGAHFDEKYGNIDDDQNTEFINQEIPVNINDQTDISGRINLSIDQERIIQKLPSFRVGDRKINDDVINSDKYLNYKEYKPLIIRNPPIFFWFLGCVFIGFAFTLIINILLYKYKKNFINGFVGHYFWEYIILVIIFIFGASFFFYSEYESIEVDKMKGIIRIYKYDMLSCKLINLDIPIKSINSIFPVRVLTQRSTSMERSCLTQIGITFNNSNTVYIFKTLFRYFTIKTIIKLRTFLYKRLQSYESVERELDGTSTYINVLQDRIR
jgi:hypothetical protein